MLVAAVAVIEQVPVPLETVIAPVDAPTEHAVDEPAEYEIVPVPSPTAATTVPDWP
jgi:hypothetical protein